MPKELYLRRIRELIANYGYAVQYVMSAPGSGVSRFAYTVGLHQMWNVDYELAVSGLGPEASMQILNFVAKALEGDGIRPVDGLEIEGHLHYGLKLRLRAAKHPENLSAIRVLYGVTPAVWQVLWPDVANRFPGDADYTLAEHFQTML